MNGILAAEVFAPVVIGPQEAKAFHARLSGFYVSGDATAVMRFLAERAWPVGVG